MIKIEATEEEIQILAGLLDVAVKTLGLRAAKSAVTWAEKLDEALKASKE